jgi:23S rRNA (cytidine1920-2'-O)/16S rRNA (cytidine1409-2'-O)-methyltransferase
MPQKPVKKRLDTLMVDKGLVPSRERARSLIMAGRVLVEGVRVEKAGKEVLYDAEVLVKEYMPYVSRGGLKLEAALDEFGVDPKGLSLLDAGASTGGFTHCLLERGAKRIIAVDVGYGQFDWELRKDPRVTLLERTNIRFLDPASLPYPVDGAVADLSFISLTLVLPKFYEILSLGGWLIPLVKPQFEVGRADVGKGGVVRDEQKMRAAIEKVKNFAQGCGFQVLGELESPVKGPKGNREFLLYLKKIDGAEGRFSS